MRLSLFDDKTHDLLKAIKFTNITATWTIVTVVVMMSIIYWALIAYTPLRTFIPGYPDARTKRAAVQNAIRVDSLESKLTYLQLYTQNLAYLLDGRVAATEIDSLFDTENILTSKVMTSSYIAERDSILRLVVRDNATSATEEKKPSAIPVEGLHFFTPLKGVVAIPYNIATHPSVDITAPANSVVAAALEGTVVFVDYSETGGYTIMLQHDNDILTVYKHNQKILKSLGERVPAGAPLALVGSYGARELGDHLRLEVWYKGETVDPAILISF